MPVARTEIRYPAGWTRTERSVADVVVLGAGQSGLAILHGLRLAGIDNVELYDAATPGRQGVWQSVARMRTLRTHKTITGPEHGNPALSFRTWLDHTQGPGSFAALERIPRLVWQDYLDWFAARIGAAPHWGHRLTGVTKGRHGLDLGFRTVAGEVVIPARHLVVATGMDGFGAAYVPEDLRARVGNGRLWHTQDDIPETVFRDRSLLVVGGSASAFDVAATALEAGAREVHQIVRGADLAPAFPETVDLRDVIAAQRLFRHLSDEARWSAVLRQRARGNAPPQSIARARGLKGHHLHFNRPTSDISVSGDAITLQVEGRSVRFDHVVCGTGYRHGAALRSEFSHLHPLARRWGDLALPVSPAQAHWGELPYLGAGFELLPRDPEQGWLSRIHVFTFASILSHGLHVGDVCSASVTVPRLTAHLARRLFEAARDQHEATALGLAPDAPDVLKETA